MHSTPVGKPTLSVCHAPLVLLRVCRSWREIALTTPQLWKSVDLALPFHLSQIAGPTVYPNLQIQARMTLIIDHIGQWFERSTNCPLSVTLRGAPFNGAMMSDIASRLAVHSSRWESIITIYNEEADRPALEASHLSTITSVSSYTTQGF